MTTTDFFAVRDDWLGLRKPVAEICTTLGCQFALPKDCGLGFGVNPSQSGYESSSTCDLVCKLDETVMKGKFPSTTTLKTIAYHIDVPGVKQCGGPQSGKAPVTTPQTGSTTVPVVSTV
jgi:hypothetical protein